MKTLTTVISLALALSLTAHDICAQKYDLLIRNGHLIDPKNKIDSKKDIAVAGGRIARVANAIADSLAKKTIDAAGLYVVPGLIDMHTHVFVGSTPDKFADGIFSLSPDDFSFRSGVTTVVDAGTSGWRNFPVFKKQVIDKSQTRILAFLSIAGSGLSGKPQQEDTRDMNEDSAALVAKQYDDIIVGIKLGHYEGSDWLPFDKALEAAEQSKLPLFIECHLPKYSLRQQLEKLRSGDIITHSFEQIAEREPIVDSSGKLREFVIAAKNRGVVFDVGHGGAGFWFSQAIPALKQGLAPHTMGTDLHRFSMNAGMKSLLNLMSKYMAMGMGLQDVIARASWNPAVTLHKKELGNLSEGVVADMALLSVQKGKFGFVDAGGNRIEGNKKLEAELTIKNGKVVWDLNGLSAKRFIQE